MRRVTELQESAASEGVSAPRVQGVDFGGSERESLRCGRRLHTIGALHWEPQKSTGKPPCAGERLEPSGATRISHDPDAARARHAHAAQALSLSAIHKSNPWSRRRTSSLAGVASVLPDRASAAARWALLRHCRGTPSGFGSGGVRQLWRRGRGSVGGGLRGMVCWGGALWWRSVGGARPRGGLAVYMADLATEGPVPPHPHRGNEGMGRAQWAQGCP
jgi:hypothetical protein|mmetsp:Transcript_31322/g.52885  ORF Transcript_31322/g.52885 Transcript_31322/m.52885 type:complete len:218 (-) Transcript_31322:223-876(-)